MLTVDDFTVLRQIAQEIIEASRIDIEEEGLSSVARVPSALTLKLADELNTIAQKE